jgi:hypothetical protein
MESWRAGPGRVAEVRARALALYGGAARWRSVARSALRSGDHSRIDRFDVWADTLAGAEGFCDVLGSTDPAGELWGIMVTPAPARPRFADMIREALAAAVAERAEAQLVAEGGTLSVADAAALADVSPQWVRAMCRSGRWRGRRIGGVWIVARASVDAFARHLTAGRPRAAVGLESVPF